MASRTNDLVCDDLLALLLPLTVVLSWGAISLGQAFVRTPKAFIAVRCLLTVFTAGYVHYLVIRGSNNLIDTSGNVIDGRLR